MHTLVKQQCNTAMLLNNIAIAIMQLLNNCSVTFAQITYKSTIATSAANKHNNVYKIVTANVQLFRNINAATSVYAALLFKVSTLYSLTTLVQVVFLQQITLQTAGDIRASVCMLHIKHTLIVWELKQNTYNL